MLENRRNQSKIVPDNYIDAYPDDSVPVTSDDLVTTLQQMNDESQ